MSYSIENEQKFERAYRDYSEAIFRYCYFRISDRERAKEIMQEVFMKTWVYIGEGKVIDNAQAFLYQIARNLTINEVTRRKRPVSLDALQEEKRFDVSEEIDVVGASDARFVLEKIKGMGSEASELIIMRFVDDIPIKKIAEILGVSKNVVSVRLHRAIEKIKEIYSYD